jgi:Skp family chaperone for outer membrane proteins
MLNQESKQKNWLIPVSILVGFLILTGGIMWAISASSFKIASIDADRVQKESTIGKKLAQDVADEAERLTLKLKAAKTQTEQDAVKLEFQQYQTKKQNELADTVKKATAKVAKKKQVKLVANSNAFVYFNIDITDDVIKELDKK